MLNTSEQQVLVSTFVLKVPTKVLAKRSAKI